MAIDFRRRNFSIGTFILLISVVTITAILMLKSYLISMTMGLILGIMVAPIHLYLMRKKVRSTASALIVTLMLTLVLIGPGLTFAGIAARQGAAFGEWLTKQETFNLEALTERVNELLPTSLHIELNENVREQAKEAATSLGMGATTFLLNLAKQIPEAMMQMFIILLTCFFVLADGKHLMKWVMTRIPIAQSLQSTLSGAFQNTAISVVWASMVAAGTQAMMMLGAFMALGIPGAFLAAGSTFIFAFIPVLGSVPVLVAGCIYLYMQGAFVKIIILAVIGVLTGVADNVVRPLVLRGRGEMHPFISLMAIFGGIQMFGFFGVFLGPIVIAVLISLIQVWPRIFSPEPSEIVTPDGSMVDRP